MIECHRGLTFSGDLEEDGDWYIGFDTSHLPGLYALHADVFR